MKHDFVLIGLVLTEEKNEMNVVFIRECKVSIGFVVLRQRSREEKKGVRRQRERKKITGCSILHLSILKNRIRVDQIRFRCIDEISWRVLSSLSPPSIDR